MPACLNFFTLRQYVLGLVLGLLTLLDPFGITSSSDAVSGKWLSILGRYILRKPTKNGMQRLKTMAASPTTIRISDRPTTTRKTIQSTQHIAYIQNFSRWEQREQRGIF